MGSRRRGGKDREGRVLGKYLCKPASVNLYVQMRLKQSAITRTCAIRDSNKRAETSDGETQIWTQNGNLILVMKTCTLKNNQQWK